MGSNQSTTAAAAACSQNHDRRTNGKPVATGSMTKRASVFLRGCETDDEHISRKLMMIQVLHPLKGEDGLDACGLEYRLVTLGEDGKLVEQPGPSVKEEETTQIRLPMSNPNNDSSSGIENNDDNTCNYQNSDHEEEKKEENPLHSPTKKNERNNSQSASASANACNHNIRMTRLFHTDSNTMITSTNRKEFIADGAMYDIVCRLAMEYCQEVMVRDGQMEWVTIDQTMDDQLSLTDSIRTKPLRALVSSRLVEDESRLDTEPTLLIITGKGRVQAGIWSRQHLLTSGLECSSAVQFVSEAHNRNMNIVVLDPNAHGDRFGMATFEKSMRHLFRRWEIEEESSSSSTLKQQIQQNLYVLSHSQSGAQFVRHLLNKAECYLPHIGAIAFTDSTHNIQWTKRNNLEALRNLLECEKSLYFRRSDKTVDYILNPFSSIGQVVDTDEFWKHRFGKIKTLCAGTSEHSLTNWFVRSHVWDHFDQFLAAYIPAAKEVKHAIN